MVVIYSLIVRSQNLAAFNGVILFFNPLNGLLQRILKEADHLLLVFGLVGIDCVPMRRPWQIPVLLRAARQAEIQLGLALFHACTG